MAPLTQEGRIFNRKLSGARVSVEQAFGILKARYRILLKRLDLLITNVSDIIVTCVVLHNFCHSQNDEYVDYDHILDELIRKERLTEAGRQRPNTIPAYASDQLRKALKHIVDYCTNVIFRKWILRVNFV